MFTWYYVGQYGQLGPLSDEQMVELAESGVISGETYVWKAGMTDWVPAATVPELNTAHTPPSPPPVPIAGTTPYALRTQTGPLEISPCSRILAGLLQFIPGVGRLYMGYLAVGTLQLVLTVCSCGLFYLWPFVDGILILAGNVKVDGYGRMLKD